MENLDGPKMPPKAALMVVQPIVIDEDTLQAIDSRDFLYSGDELRIHSVQLAEFSGIRHDNLVTMIKETLALAENKENLTPSVSSETYVNSRRKTYNGYLMTEKFAYSLLMSSDSPAVKRLLIRLNERQQEEILHLKNLHENFPLVSPNESEAKKLIAKANVLIGDYTDHVIAIIFRRCNRVIKSRSACYETANRNLQDVGNRSYDEFRYLRQMRSDALAVYIAVRTQFELVDKYPEWTYETALGFDDREHTEANAKAWLRKSRDADLTLLRDSKFPLWSWAHSFEENVSLRWEAARKKFIAQTTRYLTVLEWKTACVKLETGLTAIPSSVS